MIDNQSIKSKISKKCFSFMWDMKRNICNIFIKKKIEFELISNVHEFEKMKMEVKEWLIINQLKAKFRKNVFLLCEIWKEIYATFFYKKKKWELRKMMKWCRRICIILKKMWEMETRDEQFW
jgi:hypothetical protein